MRNKTILLVASVTLCSISPSVSADKVFAHSKSLNMSFTARGEPWCKADVDMLVTGQDAGKFATPEYATIIQKLGKVLTRECPQANTLSVTGEVAGETAWAGRAEKADGWVAHQNRLAAAEEAVAGSTETETAPVPTAAPDDGGKAVAEDAAAPANAVSSAPAPESKPAPVPESKTVEITTAKTEAAPSETPAAATAAISPESAVESESVESKPAVDTPPAIPPLVIDGWQPGGPVAGNIDDSRLQEILSSQDGCKIRTFAAIERKFKPTFKMNREYDCVGGYVQSNQRKRQDVASLYYEGQKQHFKKLSGFWVDGFNLYQGAPKEIVSLYNLPQQAQVRYGSAQNNDRLLVWIGEDRKLRAHFFSVFTANREQWRLDATPVIVLTDNDEVKNNPEGTSLAISLAEVYKEYRGYPSTDHFTSVPFVVVDKMQKTPDQTYQLALRENNPDAAFYKSGFAKRHRGMPWVIDVNNDFAAKRKAFEVAEQQRLAAEKQRLAQLRAQHQAGLDQQYKQLASASKYDQVRFYTTLKMAEAQISAGRIDFKSNRTYYGNQYANPMGYAVSFSHPAQYISSAQDGKVTLGVPMYMLVKADDGEIEKPYAMKIGTNESSVDIDGWMLVKTGPEFLLDFNDSGKPVFEITVVDGVACESDRCLDEMNASTMMQAWYDDQDMEFAQDSK